MSSSSTSLVPNTALISNVTSFFKIKLDGTNYPLWLAQVMPVLTSRNLIGYVDGTKPCPAYLLTDGRGRNTLTVDPAFDAWIQEDRMIQSWINGSLTPSVLSMVVPSACSRTIWVSLEQRYASQSQNARILQLCGELLHKRGDISISAYLNRINSIADKLRVAGSPISDHDLVTVVKSNFPGYKITANSISNPLTYKILQNILLSLEKELSSEHYVSSMSPESVTTPVYATPPSELGPNLDSATSVVYVSNPPRASRGRVVPHARSSYPLGGSPAAGSAGSRGPFPTPRGGASSG
ncbi:PREDICTED: UBN2_3 domain-containing [Prunus dulcis]|uniref:PREDICTED: UBN2_3 domain-containing n=1 Tax=Prunus dulcis TaxID=3755 RepID=A0A5E4FEU0_PRUDU|nr:hypothetical protein L3X38_044502 [Prunus dulcis]VVA26654.1 PREDICTED: UBN2_3 domain-containing [Prunus dulcis]